MAADKRSRSWREKLETLQTLLADTLSEEQAGGSTQTARLEHLVDLAVYARFLATGEIRCEEDGRHFRPTHHARLAQRIQEQLAELTTPEESFVARRLYPSLPSSAQTFQSAEPLTRIRDIAHRNDIPPELKREIKQSLQNKLHRCAGPEDMVTARNILERITVANAGYSPEFVQQFRLFHEELEEFFNAQSLERQLLTLVPAAQPEVAERIKLFLDRKSTGTDLLASLRALTEIRGDLGEWVKRNGSVQKQLILLADIGLEDFGFVLLSQLGNQLDTGEAAAPETAKWRTALRGLRLSVMNAGLGGAWPEECRAIANELQTWGADFQPDNREECVRLKATLERTRRLAEYFADQVISLFPKEAEQVGRALGVADRAIRVFAEAEIRRHVIFQTSKLVSLLLRWMRMTLGGSDWDVLVAGDALGRLRAVDSLAALRGGSSEPVVALLSQAEGDEEIAPGIVGLVVGQPTPHLSHLAVRARQHHVVFIAAENVNALDLTRALDGQVVRLTAGPDSVGLQVQNTPVAALPCPPSAQRAPVPPTRTTGVMLLQLEDITAELAGAKAMGARRLAELSRPEGAGFKTPAGVAIPFGVMEAALESKPDLKQQYERTIARLNDLPPDEFNRTVDSLANIARQFPVPSEVQRGVAERFGRNGRVIVRSSSNAEDLENSAGAGLYESVSNVPVSEVEGAVRAVWASLWTKRAARERRRSGFPHQQARMAVLIQEMLDPEYAFVLHSVNPVNSDPHQVYIEIALGLGETLVSGKSPGTPYRMVWHKDSGEVELLAFANFSHAFRISRGGGGEAQTVDYSKSALSVDAKLRERLAKELGRVAAVIDKAFQKPMDVEGAMAGEQLYVVQARPEQGLNAAPKPGPAAAPRAGPSGPGLSQPTKTKTVRAEDIIAPEGRTSSARPWRPAVLGLFEKRIAGDDALLELARLRFEQAGLGAEVHADAPEQLQSVLQFVPESGTRPVVHLPRDYDLANENIRARMLGLASRFAGSIAALLLHDRPEWASQPELFFESARALNSHLRRIGSAPRVFVEYAAGVEPSRFVGLFQGIQDLELICPCIDVGHVGIRAIRAAYDRLHPGEEIAELKHGPPELPSRMGEVDQAVGGALPAVLDLIAGLGTLGKPMHFHLHDGHPLSTASPFGVSDHLSFLSEVSLPLEHHGRSTVAPMLGPEGLKRILDQAVHSTAADRLTFTFEIHPTNERRPLGNADRLFVRWRDKTNAEIMNQWLWVLAQNQKLAISVCDQSTRTL